MANNITMSYGSYNFSPVPIINLTRDYKRTEDGRILFSTLRVGLEGSLTAETGGLSAVSNLVTGFRTALDSQGQSFGVLCGSTVVLTGYPRINNVAIKNSPNNWVNSVNYTVDLEYEDMPTGELSYVKYVDQINDEWSVKANDDRYQYSWNYNGVNVSSGGKTYELTHQVSAHGISAYSGVNFIPKQAWEYARDFCTGCMGFPTGQTLGVLSDNLTPCNHQRVQTVNEKAGKYSIQETWLLIGSGNLISPYIVLEDSNISIRTSYQTDLLTVSMNGNIQGLEQPTYNTIDMVSGNYSSSKWHNASGYLQTIVKPAMFFRAGAALTGFHGSTTLATARPLHFIPVSVVVGENPAKGTISYEYEFNNRPISIITSALVENINFSYEHPSDVYASIDVIGRTTGPIIQLINTRTPYKLVANIDIVVSGIGNTNLQPRDFLAFGTNTASPHSGVKTFLTDIEKYLNDTYTTVVKERDAFSWSAHDGKYNRSVSWLYNNCAESGTSVSLLV